MPDLVCKLRVLTPSGGGGFTLTGDFLAGRVRGRSAQSGMPSRDPLSGAPLSETVVHLLLFSTGGERASKPAAQVPPPLPDDVTTCRVELERGQARISTILTTLEQHKSPFQRFENGAPDADLGARFKAVVDRVLAATPERWQAQVECRGGQCRVNVPAVPLAEADRWRRPLETDAEVRRWIYGAGVDQVGTIYTIGDPTRPLGAVALGDLVRAFRASAPVAGAERAPRRAPTSRCRRRTPAPVLTLRRPARSRPARRRRRAAVRRRAQTPLTTSAPALSAVKRCASGSGLFDVLR